MAEQRPWGDAPAADEAADAISLLDLALPLIEHWKLWILGSLAVGLAALGIAQADRRPSPALESCLILEHVPLPNRMTILPGDTEAARLAVLRMLERSPDLSQRDRA